LDIWVVCRETSKPEGSLILSACIPRPAFRIPQ
jgi:hypothetical protein